jgi:hypothetical protein
MIPQIIGELKWPNGNLLSVCTIWMTEHATDLTKFIVDFQLLKTR